MKTFTEFINEDKAEIKKISEGGHSFKDIADSIFKELSDKKIKIRDLEKEALKKFKEWNLKKDEEEEIMSLLHSEDYFDTGIF